MAKRAQIHFTLDAHDKDRLEDILEKKYDTNITNIFRMIAKAIIVTKKIPFEYQPYQGTEHDSYHTIQDCKKHVPNAFTSGPWEHMNIHKVHEMWKSAGIKRDSGTRGK